MSIPILQLAFEMIQTILCYSESTRQKTDKSYLCAIVKSVIFNWLRDCISSGYKKDITAWTNKHYHAGFSTVQIVQWPAKIAQPSVLNWTWNKTESFIIKLKKKQKKFLNHYFWPQAIAHAVQGLALSNSSMIKKNRKGNEIKDGKKDPRNKK